MFVFELVDSYARGMAAYSIYNTPPTRLELISQASKAIREESIEAYEELKALRLYAFIEEMCDVWHTIILALAMSILPDRVPAVWVPIFFIAGVMSPMKQGRRYRYRSLINPQEERVSQER